MAEDIAPADLDIKNGWEYEPEPRPEWFYDGDWEVDPWL